MPPKRRGYHQKGVVSTIRAWPRSQPPLPPEKGRSHAPCLPLPLLLLGNARKASGRLGPSRPRSPGLGGLVTGQLGSFSGGGRGGSGGVSSRSGSGLGSSPFRVGLGRLRTSSPGSHPSSSSLIRSKMAALLLLLPQLGFRPQWEAERAGEEKKKRHKKIQAGGSRETDYFF